MEQDKSIVFQDKKIRRTFFNKEWWFVITDVIFVLTDSLNPSDYLKKVRKRDDFLNSLFKGEGQFVPPLGFEFETKGGRQIIQCWNTQGIFRLIQSIPSKKAEPFKLWLAQVGYERVQEIQNPELAQTRMIQIYKAKGYSDQWIDKRVRGIAIRDELTNEWKNRDVKTDAEYAILTAEISRATFGITPSEYKELKNLKQQNLRDHMTDLELIFTMLGEASTINIAQNKNPQGFVENKNVAIEGGTVAKVAKNELEKRSGQKVITSDNFLAEPEKIKRKLLKK